MTTEPTGDGQMIALVKVRDNRGRAWLLPVAVDPVLEPDGHDSTPTELRILKEMAGPLSVAEFKVITNGV